MKTVKSEYIPKGRPVPDPDRWWAHELTHRIGPTHAAQLIGVSRNTLANAIAGLPVYPATAAAIHHARLQLRAAA